MLDRKPMTNNNSEYVYHAVAGRSDNVALILLAYLLDFDDFPSLVDAQITEEGKEVTFFCRGKDASRQALSHDCFSSWEEDENVKGYYNYRFTSPHDFIEAFSDVYRMDHNGDRPFVSCGERLVHARKQASELRPSAEMARMQAEHESQMKQAQEYAEAKELHEKIINGVDTERKLTNKGMSEDTPLQTEEALKQSIREDQIENIVNGTVNIRS